jgi:hypothetical protein
VRISLLSEGVVLPVIPPPAGAASEHAPKDEDESVEDVDDALVDEVGSICVIKDASIWLA